jgi:hypothetical protein
MSNLVCMKSKDLSNQKKEQKIYPSQLNTKSIACRIPIADYVKFQQEAITYQRHFSFFGSNVYGNEKPFVLQLVHN